MKYNLITITAFYNFNNNFCYIIEDTERGTIYMLSLATKNIFYLDDKNRLNDIVHYLIEANYIEWINSDYIEALENEILGNTWTKEDKIKLFNLLADFREWKSK